MWRATVVGYGLILTTWKFYLRRNLVHTGIFVFASMKKAAATAGNRTSVLVPGFKTLEVVEYGTS